MPGVSEEPAVFFTELPVRVGSEKNAPLTFTSNQTAQFITDQMLYLRFKCNVDENEISNDQLFEIALVRYLAYKHRLVCANQKPEAMHVHYSEVLVFPTEGPQSVGAQLRINDRGQGLAAQCTCKDCLDRICIL